jgi:hypothetical protein
MLTDGLLAELASDERALVIAIVLARLFVPLLIPRFPLFIIAALLLDAVDNSLLVRFTEVDVGPDGPYQSFDKALDIYYLVIAYLSMMRNWTSDAAFRVGQFLLYYRLVGVLLFELTGERWMLLVFANTFEYYFIAYEVIRLRFQPSRCSARFWLLAAAAIWVFVKLPQEWWIHVRQGDFTDLITENTWALVLTIVIPAVLAAVFLLVVLPRLPAPDWGWKLLAEPLPPELAEAQARQAHRLRQGGVLWGELLEKIGLLGLLAVIFAEILPNVTPDPLEVIVSAVFVISANTAISMVSARRERFSIESSALRFGALLATNLALVWLASRLISGSEDFPLVEGLFFAFLVTIVIWLYDVYRPVYDVRFAESPLRVTSLGDFWRRVTAPTP